MCQSDLLPEGVGPAASFGGPASWRFDRSTKDHGAPLLAHPLRPQLELERAANGDHVITASVARLASGACLGGANGLDWTFVEEPHCAIADALKCLLVPSVASDRMGSPWFGG